MKHCLPLMIVASLLLCSCPQQAGNQAQPAAAPDNLPAAADAQPARPVAGPLDDVRWDGERHELSLPDCCDMLIGDGAAALLQRADFSAFETRIETESGPDGELPISVWLLPEDQTPVGFSAQLVAFGEGQRLIFGFSAAWYAASFGLAAEELDAQFRAMHEEHGGVLRNYAYLDPDFDISFFQFEFDNQATGTWGGPYMTHKRFTMHGDLPEWNFYCIGVDAGATLATRREFIAAAQDGPMPDRSLPAGIGNEHGPDSLLQLCAAGGPGILTALGIDPASGERSEGFSLARLLRPRTQLMSYRGQPEDGYPQYELLLAENSLVQQLSFTDSWLLQQGMTTAGFAARFAELSRAHAGWEKEPDEAAGTGMQDSGVIIGNWEISRRQFSLEDGSQTSSWAIRPLLDDKPADPAAQGAAD